ncbi:hypothetical protein [Actinoplanes sp. NPDC051494]|uniref:hypothetical protein n=1 Tax=Actinoplanes sp. NPDC051494 TaxID=3363907 RepID=UPI0037896D73
MEVFQEHHQIVYRPPLGVIDDDEHGTGTRELDGVQRGGTIVMEGLFHRKARVSRLNREFPGETGFTLTPWRGEEPYRRGVGPPEPCVQLSQFSFAAGEGDDRVLGEQ